MNKKVIFDIDTISHFTAGAVVIVEEYGDSQDIGHVVGFDLNCYNEVVISVRVTGGAIRMFHPTMLKVVR